MRIKFKQKSIIKQKLGSYFKTRHEIELAYLFGSVARGEANGLSDIDLAIYLREGFNQQRFPFGYKARILTDLIKILQTDRIDCVILNEAPPLLRHRVIRDGLVLYAKTERKRLAFHVKTLNEYLDMKLYWKKWRLD